jgi:signal transduction histidine kinase
MALLRLLAGSTIVLFLLAIVITAVEFAQISESRKNRNRQETAARLSQNFGLAFEILNQQSSMIIMEDGSVFSRSDFQAKNRAFTESVRRIEGLLPVDDDVLLEEAITQDNEVTSKALATPKLSFRQIVYLGREIVRIRSILQSVTLKHGFDFEKSIQSTVAVERTSAFAVFVFDAITVLFVIVALLAFGSARRYREMSERLQRLSSDLQSSEDMLQKLMATVAHEGTSHTTNILGHLSIINDEPGLSSMARESLESIRRSVSDLSEMISNLLMYSKVEAGILKLDKGKVCLSKLIGDVSRKLSLFYGDIQSRVNVSNDVEINVDYDKFCIVMRNLLTNALKNSPPGSKIEIRGIDGREHTIIEIKNEGEIPPEVLDNIFSAFNPSSKAGSIGLGLHIVWVFVREHGGEVIPSNLPEGQVVFTIVLKRETPIREMDC